MRVITFKIDDDLLSELDKYAMRNSMTRSEAIRRAINELLRREFRPRVFRIRVRKVVVQ